MYFVIEQSYYVDSIGVFKRDMYGEPTVGKKKYYIKELLKPKIVASCPTFEEAKELLQKFKMKSKLISEKYIEPDNFRYDIQKWEV